ncbi:MAG: TPD domain-containing protein [Candidatus Methanofastidiosia archaeon]
MKEATYRRLYRVLHSKESISHLSKKFRMPEELLLTILAQKIVRKTKKDYHIVKRQSKKLHREWKRGKTLLEISKEKRFSPILMASFILTEDGISKREFRKFINNPKSIEDRRLKIEILEIIENDMVYSPKGLEIQRVNGEFAESKIREWLELKRISYATETEIKREHKKTPDFLLEEVLKIDGRSINWIESKASFGDKTQMRRDYNQQLKHYLNLFGEGLVCYWNGFIDDRVGKVTNFYLDERISAANSTLFRWGNGLNSRD